MRISGKVAVIPSCVEGPGRNLALFEVATMANPKFAVGQIVEHDPRSTPVSRPNGHYRIVRVLPSEDRGPRTYRIKSSFERFERSAREYEIIPVDLPDVLQT